MEILASEGAIVEYHDPHVPQISLSGSLFADNGPKTVLRSVALEPSRLAAVDCVVVLVSHTNVDYRAVMAHAPLVFDAVNAMRSTTGTATLERL